MSPQAIRTFLNGTLAVLGALLVLELAFHLGAAPNLRLGHLVFTGDRPRFDGSVSRLLGLRDREYYFSIDEAAVTERLAAQPWVKAVKVTKTFPDTLTVDLKVRRAVAVSVVGGAVLSIDEEGRIFEVRTDARGLDLPVISGVTFEGLKAGTQFPENLKPAFQRLAALKAEAPQLFAQISEVQLQRNPRGSFDAVIYPAGTPVRVLLGDRWDQGTVGQMFVLLDLLEKQGWSAKTQEIDFRTTPVVIRPRES